MKGFFNVLKGAYPSLKQLDKSLPPKAGEAIIRGSLIKEVAGEFALTEATDATAPVAPMVYFALQGAGEPDVEMAGVVTGLSVAAPQEVETDQFTGAPAVGAYLTAGAGVLVAHADGENAYGVVTKASTYRWSNAEDAPPALVGKRTGNRVQTIALQTLFIPNLVTA